ncbi:hypothetical protein ACWKSP_37060 [Micromonosporaceae bacterium Da 78-11]
MAAPLACWLATRIRPSLFTPQERQHGKAAGVLGTVFVGEGAIPFAAAHPVAAIPSFVLGGALAGAGATAFRATVVVPHGGPLALFSAGHVVGFLTALLLGAGSTAACLVLARTRGRAGVERAELVDAFH